MARAKATICAPLQADLAFSDDFHVSFSSWGYTLDPCMGRGYFPMGSWFCRGFYGIADKEKWTGFLLTETLAQDRQE